MTIDELMYEEKDLYDEIFELGAKSRDAEIEALTKTLSGDVEASRQTGIAEERSRVVELMKLGSKYPDTMSKAISDGISLQDSYKLFFEASEKVKHSASTALTEMQKTLPESVQQEASESNAGSQTWEMELRKLTETGMKKKDAMVKLASEKPELHDEYIARFNG